MVASSLRLYIPMKLSLAKLTGSLGLRTTYNRRVQKYFACFGYRNIWKDSI